MRGSLAKYLPFLGCMVRFTQLEIAGLTAGFLLWALKNQTHRQEPTLAFCNPSPECRRPVFRIQVVARIHRRGELSDLGGPQN